MLTDLLTHRATWHCQQAIDEVMQSAGCRASARMSVVVVFLYGRSGCSHRRVLQPSHGHLAEIAKVLRIAAGRPCCIRLARDKQTLTLES